MSDTEIIDLHTDIINAFKNKFPDLKDVGSYEELEELPKAPSLFVNLVELSAVDEPINGFFCVDAVFEAYICFSFKGKPKMTLRQFIAQVAKFINKNNWGNPIMFEKAKFKIAQKDMFSPKFDDLQVWRVEWENRIKLI